MKYPQKINNQIQTELTRPKQELQNITNAKHLHKHQPQDLEIRAVKKPPAQTLGPYWLLFFAVAVISGIVYAIVISKPPEPEIVKREFHKIYEKIEINKRVPAVAQSQNLNAEVNYFEKAEIRNKINQRYATLRQNLWNEISNQRAEARQKDYNYYYSTKPTELDALYDQKNLMLRGKKSVELCEKIGEDCERAEEFLAFKKNRPESVD